MCLNALFRPMLGALAVLVLAGGCSGSEDQDAVDVAASRSAGLRVANVLGVAADNEKFMRASHPRAFSFPEDYAAHPEFRSEWWYLTMVLESDETIFGVQFTLFRQASFPANDHGRGADPWRNGQFYLAHFAITDVDQGEHREFERFSRGHPDLAGTSARPFAAWLEDWRLEERAGGGFALSARESGFAVELDFAPGRAVVPRGEGGLSRKGADQASYYYSVPRLQAAGRLVFDGRSRAVTGLGWLDREWSTSMLGERQVGWDWFALMLDNGEDLSVFQLRRSDGTRDPYDHGVLVDGDGRVHALGGDEFQLAPLQFWRDGRMVRWPVAWRLIVGDRHYIVKAMVEDQRMDTLFTYWEGAVEVLDEDGAHLGAGYMELTGY
ncbi:MAG: lipocalin-like domain-containing protein [Pseudomonadales bacterium]|nr:lipocalin-like domain-containing protein [Pseudomonadales bacterium]MDP6972854.1 lipocalin-like domain-containing protein [Pseudomonadales bacterium]